MAEYCTSADMHKLFADLGSYDVKTQLPEHDFEAYSATVDMLKNSGLVTVLYRDSEDLGAAGTLVGLSSDGDWYYDPSVDVLFVFCTNDPNTYQWESAPQDWADALADAIKKGSEILESMLDSRFSRPLPKAQGGALGRDYDYIIIKAAAICSIIELVSATDPEDAILERFQNMLSNETEKGIIDRLNDGRLRLSSEITESDRSGEIVEVTIDGNTTGYPTSPLGTPSVEYGEYRIVIDTGGTIDIPATANTTVDFNVFNIDGDTIVSAELITGVYQSIGGGIKVRFVDGVYVADDEWLLTVRGEKKDPMHFKVMDCTRL